MRARHLVIAGAVALSAVGCGASIKTATDYNHNINFSNYQSFYVKSGNSSGNPLLDQRAIADVTHALEAKGWREVPQGAAQTAVVVHAATNTKHTYETLYDGWGGWGWRRFGGGFGGATTYVTDFQVGTLVVDIFDARSKQAVWHGSATDALSDNATSNASITRQAIDKMLASFPPERTAAVNQG
ncbi:MAG: hypothetical protein JWL71_4865 [Acidobacteria bacterium]|nr:hypothetical protein [Acidobacteriota bacterium]